MSIIAKVNFSFLPLLSMCLAAFLPAQGAAPNLITIVTDDQGRWAMGAYGNPEIHTPNMDRIGGAGAMFSNAFALTPVCSPARATWLSGRYATELRITDWISPAEAAEGLGLCAPTWPQVLQQHGYRTALIGKWHLGDRPQFHPLKLGFDEFYGFLGGGNKPMDPQLEVEGEQRKVEGPLPDLLTDRAIGFLRQNRSRRFALSLHFRAPHLPYGPVPEHDRDPYADLDPSIPAFRGLDKKKVKRSTKGYYASIHSIDRNLGRLLASLDELGLAANTIVLFTSDHGYNEGRHGINTKGNGHWIVGGRSGPKRPNMWDSSIAVPMCVRWPGVVEPGTRIEMMVSNLDLFRSVLGMLGLPLPAECSARGIDFSAALRGEEQPARAAIFGQYDLHNNGLAYLRMVRTERYKYVRHFHARGMDELYDLQEDPGEKRNLFRRMSRSAEGRELIAGLHEQLELWMKSIDDPLFGDDY